MRLYFAASPTLEWHDEDSTENNYVTPLADLRYYGDPESFLFSSSGNLFSYSAVYSVPVGTIRSCCIVIVLARGGSTDTDG